MVNGVSLHIDGAAKGNPGPAAIGVIAHADDGALVFQISRYIGETTNNVAEYSALIEGLKMAQEHDIKRIHVASDSQLLVRQIQGLYQVKKPHLKRLYSQVVKLMRNFDQVKLVHVPREENVEADALANQAIKEERMKDLG